MLTINKINSRRFNLSKESQTELNNYSMLECYNEEKDKFNQINTITKIRNWEGLGDSQLVNYIEALSNLNLMIEHCLNRSSIITECSFLVSEMSKVRDILQLKNSIKYQQAQLKKKLKLPKTDIKGAAVKAKDAFAPTKKHDSEETAEECYSMLLDELMKLSECDRIVKNYTGVNKTFGVENIINEYGTNRRDYYDVVYSIASCCSSFDTPFRNMYNTALETAWYGFGKKHLSISHKNIIEAVTDFFIFNGGLKGSDVQDIAFIESVTPVFSSSDFSCIKYLYPKEFPYPIISEVKTFDDLIQADIPKLETDKETNRDKIKKVIKDFKLSCSKNSDSSMNIPLLKALIIDISSKYPKEVEYFLSSLLQIIRMSFIINNFSNNIKPIKEILDKLVKALISTQPDLAQVKSYISKLKNESDYIKNRLDKIQDQDVDNDYKNILSDYQDYLVKTIAGLDEYIIYTFKDAREKAFPGSTDDDLPPEEVDFKEYASIQLIHNLSNTLLEDVIDQDVTKIITGNISKYSSGMLAGLVDLTNTSPEIIDKESLKENLVILRNNLRQKDNVSSYIKIDEINNNLYNLERPMVYRDTSKPTYTIGCLMCLNEFKQYAMELDSHRFPEDYFIESINILVNQKESLEDQNISFINNAIESIVKSIKEDYSENQSDIEKACLLALVKFTYLTLENLDSNWLRSAFLSIISLIDRFFTHPWRTDSQKRSALEQIEHCIGVCEKTKDHVYVGSHQILYINNMIQNLTKVFHHINYTLPSQEVDNNESNA